ncbi:MAG: hypothetical protein RMI94_11330 [Bryobacterales bacterium]|nr:hypothetical protein [Bryobacteraceae bacterium]MDW8131133.1 hypothetical protein [Bryobacterales bacterium]
MRLERFAFGLRLRTLPFERLSVMREGMAMQTTFSGTTAYDFNANTTSKSPVMGGGLAFEFRLAKRVRLSSELLFHRLRYESSTATYWGKDDPATGNDDRTQSSVREQTKARLWDLPVLVHYRGLRSSGPLSHVWVGAGVAGRTISTIRTKAEIKKPDGSSSVQYNATAPARRTLAGIVVALGLRFVDDMNIKVMPEIRFTRWSGSTFSSFTTRSPRSQLEFGVSFLR